MNIICISDTHNKHRDIKINLENVDVLVHAGDFTNFGSYDEVCDFLDWFEKQPVPHRVLIAGNHERGLDQNSFYGDIRIFDLINSKPYYLNSSSITINGIKFYGSPYTLVWGEMSMWGFELNKDIIIYEWLKIPKDVDVLVTHQPPYKILDYYPPKGNLGCESLLDTVIKIKPKVHIFGHIHEQNGIVTKDGVTFVNAGIVDENHNIINEPRLVNLNVYGQFKV